MASTTYNGWTNYATWRVMLEVFDGYPLDNGEVMDSDYAREMVLDMIDSTTTDGLVRDWALSFVQSVNWTEIAEAVNANNNVEE